MSARDLVEQFGAPAVEAVRAQFPRACSSCARPYRSFASFCASAEPVGEPYFDANDDEDSPVGVLCFFNCPCGSTLALRFEDVTRHAAFNQAVREVARATGTDELEVLEQFVAAVSALAMGAEARERADAAKDVVERAPAGTLAHRSGLASLLDVDGSPLPARRESGAERRRAPRVEVDLVVRERVGDRLLVHAATNLSATGIFIEGYVGLAVNAVGRRHLDLELQLPGERDRLAVRGEVVAARRTRSDALGLAVRFLELGAEHRSRLGAFVDRALEGPASGRDVTP